MVWGKNGNPETDQKTEGNNPYIFTHLPKAIKIAQQIASSDYYAISRVIEIKNVVIFSGTDFISPDKTQD